MLTVARIIRSVNYSRLVSTQPFSYFFFPRKVSRDRIRRYTCSSVYYDDVVYIVYYTLWVKLCLNTDEPVFKRLISAPQMVSLVRVYFLHSCISSATLSAACKLTDWCTFDCSRVYNYTQVRRGAGRRRIVSEKTFQTCEQVLYERKYGPSRIRRESYDVSFIVRYVGMPMYVVVDVPSSKNYCIYIRM